MKKVAGLIVLAALLCANSSTAQTPLNIKGYVGVGIDMPTGILGDGWNMGFHGEAALGFLLPAQPFEILGEIAYHSFGLDDQGTGIDGGTFSAFRFGVAAKVRIIPSVGTTAPFFSFGVGFAQAAIGDIGGFSFPDETKPYIKLGGGVDFLKFFAKVEYVNVFTEGESAKFVPITFGVRF
ncbi:MAG: hypothetical protein SGI97_06055 [candidate division Zixibacteria bacterium]|nr:hypothetical protein [candidate division Zixibacteria bacterium]